MKFKAYLIEAFDNPYKWKQTNVGRENRFIWYDDEGSKYEMIAFYVELQDQLMGFPEKTQEKYEDISYKMGYVINFTKDGKFNLTNDSNAFKVFATVKEIFDKVISKENPDYISFGSSINEKSRIKFYDRLTKYVKSKLKYNKSIKEKDLYDQVVFISYKG